MPTQKLTPEIVTAAIAGFEQQKRRIDSQIAELRTMLSDGHKKIADATEPTKRKRRKMSAAARKRIAEAQRKRWAESKVLSEAPATQEAPKKKRKLSAAGRKAIIVATKRRWALKRAEAAKS
jgi:peptidoglycan hydrolase CwlO-like protein